MNTIAIRFDIDTHKCIRDGVPRLLALSERYGVPFTFFLNTGRAVDLRDSLQALFRPGPADAAPHLSARAKLGTADYLYCAVCNPPLMRYRAQIDALLASRCEVGLHGGRNHALWARDFARWDAARVCDELDFALRNLRSVAPGAQPGGFASPCWAATDDFLALLRQKGFRYSADLHAYGLPVPVRAGGPLPLVGVNLLGEPGGVAWFETCVAQGLPTEEIVQRTMQFVQEHPVTVLYDHPYFAGCDPRALAALEGVLAGAQQAGCRFATLQELTEVCDA